MGVAKRERVVSATKRSLVISLGNALIVRYIGRVVVVANNGIDGYAEALEHTLYAGQKLHGVPYDVARKEYGCGVARIDVLLDDGADVWDYIPLKARDLLLGLGLRVAHDDEVEATTLGTTIDTRKGGDKEYDEEYSSHRNMVFLSVLSVLFSTVVGAQYRSQR